MANNWADASYATAKFQSHCCVESDKRKMKGNTNTKSEKDSHWWTVMLSIGSPFYTPTVFNCKCQTLQQLLEHKILAKRNEYLGKGQGCKSLELSEATAQQFTLKVATLQSKTEGGFYYSWAVTYIFNQTRVKQPKGPKSYYIMLLSKLTNSAEPDFQVLSHSDNLLLNVSMSLSGWHTLTGIKSK